jgi:hypothetical protein
VGLGDGADDGQPQAGTALVTAPCFVEAGESLEDALPVLDGDPGAVVVDGELDRSPLLGDGHSDGGAGVAGGVGQQVLDQADELVLPPDDLAGTDAAGVDRDRRARRQRSDPVEDELVEVDGMAGGVRGGLVVAHECQQLVGDGLEAADGSERLNAAELGLLRLARLGFQEHTQAGQWAA